VNCAAWTRASRAGSWESHCVTKTLATVAAKRSAFVRHASGANGRVESGAEGLSLGRVERVAEGGGESVESGGEAGIDGSYIGV